MSVERPVHPETARQNETIRGGPNLIRLRKLLGWSQAKLAQESDLTQGYLCQLEHNEVTTLGYAVTIKLARALGCTINFWQGQEDNRVFLTSPTRMTNEIIENPASPVAPVLSAYIESVIPQLPDPNVTYIDWRPTYQKIGDKIYSLRTAETNPLTQDILAELSDLSQGFISQLERTGDRTVKNPSLRTLAKIAAAFHVDLYDLLDLREVDYPPKVVTLDRFFRSDQIATESKKKIWQVLSLFRNHPDNPILAQTGQETSATLAQ